MTTTDEWRARVGDVWAAEWRRTDRSLADLSRHLDAAIRAAAPASGGTVLDIGCGAGATSAALHAARPDLAITGIDLSSALIAVARSRVAGVTAKAVPPNDAAPRRRPGPSREGVRDGAMRSGSAGIDREEGSRASDTGGTPMSGVTFRVGDAAADPLSDAPDLVVSRHGVMFFADPVAAFAHLHAAAAPGAKLVFSCFADRARNAFAGDLVGAVTGAMPADAPGYAPGPFAFASPERTAAILERAGWAAPSATPVAFDYVAGEGDDPVADAVDFLSRIGPLASVVAAAPDRAALLSAALLRYRVGDRVVLPASAWIWRAAKGEA